MILFSPFLFLYFFSSSPTFPKNLGVDPFPDPVGHFRAPGGHFGFLMFSEKEWSNKETYLAKVDQGVQ